jgi:Type IV secretion-system coupling protein DNA-binding domain
MNHDDFHSVYVGFDYVWGTPISITDEDRRRHVYIIGLPGAGKSRLMENLFLQDVYAGRGAAFLDPHGTSAERVLDHIPSYRHRDVVYFHPADVERPIGLNIFKGVDKTDHKAIDRWAQGIVGTFKSVWRDSWGPRMERIFSNAVLALLEYPDSTLLGVLRILVDNAYRKRIAKNLRNPVIRAYWEVEYPAMQKEFKQGAIDPIQNKVERFLASTVMRNIFGQKQCAIDFFDVMNSNKIFIANLASGEIGEINCNLAGSLIIHQFYLAALKRITLPEEDRTLYPFHVDEIHSFATESFGDILAQTRKFGLSFCGANQFLDQLNKVDENLRSAVLGTSGTRIAFRVGGEDAGVLRKDFAPWPAEELMDLDNTKALIKLLYEGKVRGPFQMQTYETPPHIKLQSSQARYGRNYSRFNYGTPRAEVEAQISRWMQGMGQNASEATLKRVARTIAPKQSAMRKNRG